MSAKLITRGKTELLFFCFEDFLLLSLLYYFLNLFQDEINSIM